MTEEKKTEKKPSRNIGAVAREAILAGKSNKEALEAVQAEFPGCNTTLNSINWYRNDLRKKGHNVPKVARSNAKKKKEDDLTS
jgi:predicted phage tail protein